MLALAVDARVGRSWGSWSTKARSGAVPERWRRADGKRIFVEVTMAPGAALAELTGTGVLDESVTTRRFKVSAGPVRPVKWVVEEIVE